MREVVSGGWGGGGGGGRLHDGKQNDIGWRWRKKRYENETVEERSEIQEKSNTYEKHL